MAGVVCRAMGLHLSLAVGWLVITTPRSITGNLCGLVNQVLVKPFRRAPSLTRVLTRGSFYFLALARGDYIAPSLTRKCHDHPALARGIYNAQIYHGPGLSPSSSKEYNFAPVIAQGN